MCAHTHKHTHIGILLRLHTTSIKIAVKLRYQRIADRVRIGTTIWKLIAPYY